MRIKPIKTKADYDAALEEIERLFDAVPDTKDGDQLEVLVTLVEAYEEKHHPIPLPDPIDAIEYHMESHGLSRADLEPYIGSRGRVSEVLNRKRPLSLRMMRLLQKGLGIPAEVLMQPYNLVGEDGVTHENADLQDTCPEFADVFRSPAGSHTQALQAFVVAFESASRVLQVSVTRKPDWCTVARPVNREVVTIVFPQEPLPEESSVGASTKFFVGSASAIDHIWTVVCSSSVIDRDANNLSLLNVIEQLRIQGSYQPGGAVLVKLDVVTLWVRRDPDMPCEGHARLVLLSPTNKALREKPFSIDLQEHMRFRSRIHFDALPVGGNGRHLFQLELQNAQDDGWQRVAQVPVWVEFVPEKTDETETPGPEEQPET